METSKQDLVDSQCHSVKKDVDLNDKCTTTSDRSVTPTQYRTYKTRWYVLILYAALGISQNMVYSTISPIAPLAQKGMGLTQADISLLSNWYNIMFIVGLFPFMWLIQTKGLRQPVVLGALFMTTGAATRCLSTHNQYPLFDKVFLHLGQIINGAAASVVWFGCTKVSATWFPPSERTISTAIALVAGGFGVAISFLVGPYVVTNLADKWGGPDPAPEDIEHAIRYLLYGEAIVCGILCIFTIFFFPSAPPTPPCYTAAAGRFDFLNGLVQFSKSKDAWLIFVLYSISAAVLAGWTLFLSITVGDVLTAVQSGWLGFGLTTAQVFSGPITSLTIKWWPPGKHKMMSAAIMFCGASLTVVFLVATIVGPSMLTPPLIWGTLVTATFLICGCQPLWWEMACEASYPVPEETISGIFALGFVVLSLFFFIAYSFPQLGTQWSNWFLGASECACVPLILFCSGEKRRLAEDEQAIATNGGEVAETTNNSNAEIVMPQ